MRTLEEFRPGQKVQVVAGNYQVGEIGTVIYVSQKMNEVIVDFSSEPADQDYVFDAKNLEIYEYIIDELEWNNW